MRTRYVWGWEVCACVCGGGNSVGARGEARAYGRAQCCVRASAPPDALVSVYAHARECAAEACGRHGRRECGDAELLRRRRGGGGGSGRVESRAGCVGLLRRGAAGTSAVAGTHGRWRSRLRGPLLARWQGWRRLGRGAGVAAGKLAAAHAGVALRGDPCPQDQGAAGGRRRGVRPCRQLTSGGVASRVPLRCIRIQLGLPRRQQHGSGTPDRCEGSAAGSERRGNLREPRRH